MQSISYHNYIIHTVFLFGCTVFLGRKNDKGTTFGKNPRPQAKFWENLIAGKNLECWQTSGPPLGMSLRAGYKACSSIVCARIREKSCATLVLQQSYNSHSRYNYLRSLQVFLEVVWVFRGLYEFVQNFKYGGCRIFFGFFFLV